MNFFIFYLAPTTTMLLLSKFDPEINLSSHVKKNAFWFIYKIIYLHTINDDDVRFVMLCLHLVYLTIIRTKAD